MPHALPRRPLRYRRTLLRPPAEPQGPLRGPPKPCGVLSPLQRVLYASGTLGSSLLQQTVLLWTFYYYAPPPGQGLPTRATPLAIGLAMGLGRLVDAVVDPLVAHWSDTRPHGARRRPLILIGGPAMAAVFALLWRPPHDAPTLTNTAYLAAGLGLFFLLFTVVLNPYMALLPEVTRPGPERVATAAWQSGFTLAGTGLAAVASAQIATRVGFPAMGLALAPVGAVSMVVAALAVREGGGRGTLALLPSLRAVLRNPAFRVFIAGFAMLWLGLSLVNPALALIVTVLMGLPRAAVGTVLGASVLLTLAATPVVAALSHRLGVHRTLMLAMGVACGALPLLASVGRWPVAWSPAAQGYAVIVLAAPALAALFALPNTLLADIAHAAGHAGARNEGMFFAFQGLLLNGATSVGALILGALLDAFGYAAGLRAAPAVAAAFVAGSLIVFRRYPSAAQASSPR